MALLIPLMAMIIQLMSFLITLTALLNPLISLLITLMTGERCDSLHADRVEWRPFHYVRLRVLLPVATGRLPRCARDIPEIYPRYSRGSQPAHLAMGSPFRAFKRLIDVMCVVQHWRQPLCLRGAAPGLDWAMLGLLSLVRGATASYLLDTA